MLAGVAVGVYAATDSSGGSAATGVTAQMVAATLGTVRESVSTTGTVEPAHDDSLSFAVSGTVTAVKVAEGDTVHKYEVLATVDSATLKASLAQARAALATDRAKVSADEADDATDAQLTADKAAVSAAKGQVSSARTALDDAKLRSPISGVVASVGLSVGDTVTGSGSNGTGGANGSVGGSNSSSSSSSSSSGSSIEVISTSAWTASASVDATDVGNVKAGDQAQLTVDGVTGTVYGIVTSVGVVASTSDTGSATYPVTVSVTGNPSGLHAGETATIALIYKQLTNVLTVPSTAVHVGNGSSYVYTTSDGTTSGKRIETTVTTGLSSGGSTQITSGLKQGDKVLLQIAVPTGAGNGGQSQTTRGFLGKFGNTGFGGGTFTGGGSLPGGVSIPSGIVLPGGGN